MTQANRKAQIGLPGVAEGEAWMYTNRQQRYQVWSGTILISGTKAWRPNFYFLISAFRERLLKLQLDKFIALYSKKAELFFNISRIIK